MTTNARRKRRYRDSDREAALAALAANADNIKKTANQLGIPIPTLRCWARGTRHSELQLQHEKKGELADALETVAWAIIETMPSKLEKSSLRDLSISLGVTIDKMRLLREQATAIASQTEELTDEQRVERFRELALRIRQRRPSAPDSQRTPGISLLGQYHASKFSPPRLGSMGDGAVVGQKALAPEIEGGTAARD